MGLCLGCRKKLLSPIYKGHKVEVTKAPTPEDIIWENVQAINSEGAALKRLGVLLIMIFLLAATLGVNVALKSTVVDEREPTMADELISLCIACVIAISNFAIERVLMYFMKYERIPTYSEYYNSLVRKISYIQVMNSLFSIFFTHWILHRKDLKHEVFKKEGSMAQDYEITLYITCKLFSGNKIRHWSWDTVICEPRYVCSYVGNVSGKKESI